jgi:predicted double-glycine peptidase
VYDGPESFIQKVCKTTPEDGTSRDNIAKVARLYGLKVIQLLGTNTKSLALFLNQGYTVILNYQAWADQPKNHDYTNDYENGHYGVLVDMDSQNMVIMDPSIGTGYGVISVTDFVKRWHDLDNGVKEDGIAIVITGKQSITQYPELLPIL